MDCYGSVVIVTINIYYIILHYIRFPYIAITLHFLTCLLHYITIHTKLVLLLALRPPTPVHPSLVYSLVSKSENLSGNIILYSPTCLCPCQHHSLWFALTLVVLVHPLLADEFAPNFLVYYTPTMPSSKSTIFFLAALAVVGPVAMSQPANALQAMGPPPVRRAEHIHLAHKMTRKRSPSPRVVPIRRQDTPQSGPAATSPDPSGGGVLDPVLTESTVASSRTPDPNSRPSTTTQSQPPRQTVRVYFCTTHSSCSTAQPDVLIAFAVA